MLSTGQGSLHPGSSLAFLHPIPINLVSRECKSMIGAKAE